MMIYAKGSKAGFRRIALTVGVLLVALATGATAGTQVEFTLINTTQTPSVGSNSRTVAIGGPYWGTLSGTIILEFAGNGTTISAGPVSIVGGTVNSYQLTAVPPLITVEADIASTYRTDGVNNEIGNINFLNWSPESSTIGWSQQASVLNNGTLSCDGSACGSLGTPPDGETITYIDDPVTYPEPYAPTVVEYNPESDPPFHIQFTESVIGLDEATGNPAQYHSMEGEGYIVPEPGAAASAMAALATLGLLRRRHSLA